MSERPEFRPFASPVGIGFMCGLLLSWGAMCPKCGHGTRVTSKRWARCKKCNTRVRRNEPPARSLPGEEENDG